MSLIVTLTSSVKPDLAGYIVANASEKPPMVRRVGRGAVLICGSGPSLNHPEAVRLLRAARGPVWACNTALPYLLGGGYRVTHGVAVDPTLGMLRDWPHPPRLRYLLASSVSPALVEHIRRFGGDRTIAWFHSWCGIEDELAWYARWFPPGVCVGEGYVVLTRAIGLAEWMGYRRIVVLGGDLALGPGDVLHAWGTPLGGSGQDPCVVEGVIAGRTWRTKPDFLLSAVALERVARRLGDRLALIGDTLPAALRGMDDAALDRIARADNGPHLESAKFRVA